MTFQLSRRHVCTAANIVCAGCHGVVTLPEWYALQCILLSYLHDVVTLPGWYALQCILLSYLHSVVTLPEFAALQCNDQQVQLAACPQPSCLLCLRRLG